MLTLRPLPCTQEPILLSPAECAITPAQVLLVTATLSRAGYANVALNITFTPAGMLSVGAPSVGTAHGIWTLNIKTAQCGCYAAHVMVEGCSSPTAQGTHTATDSTPTTPVQVCC
jgi:hypothetical protein